jgi:SagB-type dehydrogenase family enzyme
LVFANSTYQRLSAFFFPAALSTAELIWTRVSSLIILITAVFERSTIKYGDRGYRFALLEAGHVAQNINLVANALGLGSINLGGYFDRRADDFLGIDGLTHSTIYMAGIGAKTDSSDARVGTRPE